MARLLTIVLPTFNRRDYLEQTLALFESQIKRNNDRVRFVISNNASDDGTAEMLEKFHFKSPFFDYVNFSDYVDVGLSITRTCDLADTEYVLMWGDDDYPIPYLVDYILDCLIKYPDTALIHFNRLYGRDNKMEIKELSVQYNKICYCPVHQLSVKECVNNFILDMSFLTTIVFKRSYWENNKGLDCSKHYGYEFLGHILHGMGREKALYIDYPMCIQRKPAMRSWMQRSPLFRFIGIPNMYNDFEKWGLTDNAKDLWMRQGNNQTQFMAVISQASMYKNVYRPLFKEICSHQYTVARKIIAFFFIFLCPSWLYKVVRRMKYN